MSGRTLPLGPVCSDLDDIRRLSAERYGQTVADAGPLVAADDSAPPSLGVVRRRP
jgi:hypothetical protein